MEYSDTMEASLVTKNSTLALLECVPTYCAVTEDVRTTMKSQFEEEKQVLVFSHMIHLEDVIANHR